MNPLTPKWLPASMPCSGYQMMAPCTPHAAHYALNTHHLGLNPITPPPPTPSHTHTHTPPPDRRLELHHYSTTRVKFMQKPNKPWTHTRVRCTDTHTVCRGPFSQQPLSPVCAFVRSKAQKKKQPLICILCALLFLNHPTQHNGLSSRRIQ